MIRFEEIEDKDTLTKCYNVYLKLADKEMLLASFEETKYEGSVEVSGYGINEAGAKKIFSYFAVYDGQTFGPSFDIDLIMGLIDDLKNKPKPK